MVYPPQPPDCSEIIEKDVIPVSLKRWKYFCISLTGIFIFIGIVILFDVPSWLVWALFILVAGIPYYCARKIGKIAQCPNCGEPLNIPFTIPKECEKCRARLRK